MTPWALRIVAAGLVVLALGGAVAVYFMPWAFGDHMGGMDHDRPSRNEARLVGMRYEGDGASWTLWWEEIWTNDFRGHVDPLPIWQVRASSTILILGTVGLGVGAALVIMDRQPLGALVEASAAAAMAVGVWFHFAIQPHLHRGYVTSWDVLWTVGATALVAGAGAALAFWDDHRRAAPPFSTPAMWPPA